MWRAVIAMEEVAGVLGECEHLILHFHGPVCDMPAWSGIDVTSQLRGLLAGHGVPLRPPAGAAISPYDILRFTLTACPQLAGQAEAEVAAPSACAVVASTPADIRSARRAGARAIGYACDPAARQRLTAAGAEAVTADMTELAGSAYLAAAIRRRAGGWQATAK